MKKRITTLLAIAAVATFASPAVVRAQVSNPLKFTIFGGAALPAGDTGDDVKTGYNVGGAVDFRVPLSPIGARGELVYSNFDAKDTGGAGSASLSDFGANANVVFWLPSAGSPLSAYFTGGPSYARLKAEASSGGVSGSITENHWGFNAGAGIDFALGSLSTRLDARYRRISTDGSSVQSIPITFGITF
jgi:hypothetical protein